MLIKLTLILWSFACTLINMDGLEIVCKLKTGIIRLAGQFLHRCAPRGDAMPYPPGCPQLAQGSLKITTMIRMQILISCGVQILNGKNTFVSATIPDICPQHQ